MTAGTDKTTALSPVRRWVQPAGGEGWAEIAARALPDMPPADAVSRLQSWNLHVFLRAPAAASSPRAGNPVLPSDIIFIEPPLAPA
jgi:hypothetical protein